MAHALRHFFGSQLAVRGVPLPIIQQLKGPIGVSFPTRTLSSVPTRGRLGAIWQRVVAKLGRGSLNRIYSYRRTTQPTAA
jgi:hypothetical protein